MMMRSVMMMLSMMMTTVIFDLDAAYDDNDDAWNLINGRLIKGIRPYIGHQ